MGSVRRKEKDALIKRQVEGEREKTRDNRENNKIDKGIKRKGKARRG